MCERRSGGVKSTLKPAQNGATSFRVPRSTTRNSMLEDTVFGSGPSGRVTDGRTQRMANPQLSDGSTKQWGSYANGGAHKDDQRLFAKGKDEEELYYTQIRPCTPGAGRSSAGDKLIHISPEKTANVSRNTDLLLDLDFEPQYLRDGQDAGRSNAKAVSSIVAKSIYTNLLD